MHGDPVSDGRDVYVGVDTGGTFTDVVAYAEAAGRLAVAKVSSTPGQPDEAVVQGLRAVLGELGVEAASIRLFAHGTTVATNALLERRGARTGLLTTAGFRDVYEIRRLNRSYEDLYNLFWTKPEPLAPRRLRHEVAERMTVDGTPRSPLDVASVQRAAEALRAEGVESVAVCLLHSYRNPAHEERLGELLEELLPSVSVSLSHVISPQYREYERTATTVVNAYVAPVVGRYLGRLDERLQEVGVPAGLHVMHSAGGTQTSAEAQHRAVTTVLSGPAAGVTAAVELADRGGHPHVITLDMGGTSTDMALLRGGSPRTTAESEVGGEPIRVPMLDISTIGAGGGSIAWCDEGGLVHVGPQSAGADPGPVCYGRGGVEPTVTDANLVLGFLDAGSFLGGQMRLDRAAAEEALAAFGVPLGLSATEAARSIFELVNANMLRAMRAISVERGLDPRQFALLAFGGAGPVHAAALAAELGSPAVIVPERPGNFSALGLLVADLRRDAMRTSVLPLVPESAGAIDRLLTELSTQLSRDLEVEGHDPARIVFERSAEARYVGQAYELPVLIAGGEVTGDGVLAAKNAFHAAHEERYGHCAPGEDVEGVNFRVTATAPTPGPRLRPRPGGSGEPQPAGTRTVWFGAGEPTATPVFERDELRPGMSLPGPALIVEVGSTTVVHPGQLAEAGALGEMRIDIRGGGG